MMTNKDPWQIERRLRLEAEGLYDACQNRSAVSPLLNRYRRRRRMRRAAGLAAAIGVAAALVWGGSQWRPAPTPVDRLPRIVAAPEKGSDSLRNGPHRPELPRANVPSAGLSNVETPNAETPNAESSVNVVQSPAEAPADAQSPIVLHVAGDDGSTVATVIYFPGMSREVEFAELGFAEQAAVQRLLSKDAEPPLGPL